MDTAATPVVTEVSIPSVDQFLASEGITDAPAVEGDPPPPPPPAKPDSMAAKFSAIARKEREALAIRESAVALQAKYQKVEGAIAQRDAIAALEAMGLDFDEALSAYIEKQSIVAEVDPRDARLAEMEKKLAAREAAEKEREEQATVATHSDYRRQTVGDIQKLIAATTDLDRVARIEGSADEIYDALNQHWVNEGGKGDAQKFIATNFPKAARILEAHYEAEYRRLAPRSVTASETHGDAVATAIEDSRQPRTLTNSTVSGQTRPVVDRAMTPDEALEEALASLKR